MIGIRILHICQKEFPEELPVKNINSHGSQVALWLSRFFFKFYNLVCLAICIHDSETACFFHWNFDNGDSSICFAFFVECKHFSIIHFINMVTGKNQKIFRCERIDKIDILGNSVCSSAVNVKTCVCFFTWRQYIYAAVLGIQTPTSSGCYIAVQENRLILGQNTYYINSTVCTVTEGEIHDAVFSSV